MLLIKEVSQDELILKAFNFDYFCFSSETNYLIYENSKLIGFLCGSYNSLTNDLFIEMVELKVKGKGYGKILISELFNQLNLYSLSGSVLYEPSHRPFYFWKSVGSSFSGDYSDYCESKDSSLRFSLLNPSLVFA